MSAVTDARARLAAGYYNSNAKAVSNPGGLAANGHQSNFPAALLDLGLVLVQAGADAAMVAAALPDIATAVGALAATLAARDAAIAAKNQAVEVVGVDISNKANLNSPALTGTPTAPTPAVTDNSARIATTAHLKAWWATQVGAAPGALDAIYELAAALGNDPNFATSMATALAAKVAKAGDTMAGPLSFLPAAGRGSITHNGGAGALPGFIEFLTGDGIRRGYLGGASGTTLLLASENGYNWGFTARPTWAGLTPWDSGNLSPVDLGSAQTVTGLKSFSCANQLMTSPSAATALQVLGTGSGAYLAFNRPSAYAVFFGLDVDNQLKMGGGSMGAVSTKLWTDANDGSGSGLDADLVRGRASATGATADTLAVRGSGGQLQATGYELPSACAVSWPTHGGGLSMSDNTWVQITGDKSLKTGGALQAGIVRETSDVRLKRNFQPIENAGALVDRTDVFLGEKLVGGDWVQCLYVLAQDQREVTPWAVGEDAEPYQGGPPLLGVDYGQLALLAIQTLKEERRRADVLDERLARAEAALGIRQ